MAIITMIFTFNVVQVYREEPMPRLQIGRLLNGFPYRRISAFLQFY